MGMFGPSATRTRTSKKGASPIYFLRILEYARPWKRYLITAICCVIFVAATYSISIVALFPLIKVIGEEQSIPNWINQSVAEDRFDLALTERKNEIVVRDVDKDSKLATHVGIGDRLVRVGTADMPQDILNTMANAPDAAPVELSFRPSDSAKPEYSIAARPEDASWSDRFTRWIAWKLPAGDSRDAKWKILIIIALGILAVSAVGGFCRFWGEYLIALVAGLVVMRLRKIMYDRVLRLPLSHFAQFGTSDLMTRFVQDSQEVYRGLVFVFAKSLREPLKAFFVIILALIIDWRITLIALIGAPIAAFFIRRFGKKIRRANKRLLGDYGRMLGALGGALGGIRVVKGYAMENYERRHLHAVDREILKQQLKIERTEALASPLFEGVGRIVATIAIFYFAHLMFAGEMSFSKFATLGACMAGIFDPVRKMSSFYNRMQRANAALERVYEVIDLPGQVPDDHLKPAMPAFSESIEFRDIRFTYPGAEKPALDGISLTIRRGERVAFVGPNGSGKTTLLSLLLRFFDPDSGQLLIDGSDARDYSLVSLRRQMSLITQDSVIFADTIRNNIAYGDDRLLRTLVLRGRHPDRAYNLNSDMDRIVDAAKAAYADEFIADKPQGYDTFVGEQGAQLSGGQKQRLAIARAILRNAPIFIFDEATSQIDAESEKKIHDAVEKFLQDRTALIIAHRFSTILQADRIVVMDRGRIVDSGTHDELINRCGLYQSLYGSQILSNVDPSGAVASQTSMASSVEREPAAI
ncbi:MAG TPA: ABC transporter ATP-binding protein [Phycisphaerae bacterium]|nr:ABC transporter ATP-binding protein [Phycisphaerae bacterium]